MTINARAITRPDPGAIPGGSTKSCFPFVGRTSIGADQDRRMAKDVAFVRMGFVTSPFSIVANDNYAEEVALAA